MLKRWIAVTALISSMFGMSAVRATAQDASAYPARTVKIVVSTPAGSQQDVLGRMLADGLRAQFNNQAFIVMNVPGAGSVASAAYVARQPADGYTILVANAAPIGIAKALRSDLPYNPTTDLTPVGQLTASYFLVVENPQVPAQTLPELIALLKKSPGKYNYASSGIGGMVDMETELFMLRTGTKMTQVPYTSSGEVTEALLSGYVGLSVDTTDALPEVQQGKLRALAVTSPQRFPELPNVPTVHEVVPEYGVGSVWQGVFVRSGTPSAIVDRLNKAIGAFLTAPATVAKMKTMELTPTSSASPAQFAAMVDQDSTTWAEVIKANGIKTH